MTNDETRMTNQIRMTNARMSVVSLSLVIRHSPFGYSSLIRHSGFVIWISTDGFRYPG
jgi:hypothetical protein